MASNASTSDARAENAPGLSRRELVSLALAGAALGCERGARALAANTDAGLRPWGGLTVARVDGMREDERGGHAIVLLHGWRAAGDDLVPLGEQLKRPGVRFFVPAAPLPEPNGGRAWWYFDPANRPPHAESDRLPAGFRPTPQLVAARAAVQGLVATVLERYRPASVALAGFSQGAMLSIDAALAGTPGVDRVVAMSGRLLADSIPGLLAPHPTRPRFLLSHGRQDPMVAFSSGLLARDLLQKHGFDVTWCPFDGRHQIPGSLLPDIERFLFA